MTYNVRAHSYVVGGLGITGQACVRFLTSNGAKVKAFDTRDTATVSEPLNVEITTGSLPDTFFDGIDTLVLSPGLPLNIAQVEQARAAGVEVIGDVELFARVNQTPAIGITGSNGKTTVTLLTTHLLKACGYKVMEAGNVGRPVLDTLCETLDVVVIELSSFQLETTSSLALRAATILNISDDHLDRHGDMQRYAAAKQRIFTHCNIPVNWRGHPTLAPVATNSAAVAYGLDESSEDFGLQDGFITFNGRALLNTADIPMTGQHNVLNVMTALALCHAFGAPLSMAARAVSSFQAAPHRCVEIANTNGVRWIDDSKATNVGATIAAIDGLSTANSSILLIAGGDAKGADLQVLQPYLAAYVTQVIALGKDAEKFKAVYPDTLLVDSMDSAVAKANALAQPGDIVLLSPACASIDMFKNYIHRADTFARAVAQFANTNRTTELGGCC